jgi:hypothetical protein
MNPNIEVINKKLWAVRFSYLPYIQEIQIIPDKAFPIEDEPGRIAPGGLMILNKDYRGYDILKDLFPKLMKKKERIIEKELKAGQTLKEKSNWQNLYYAMLQVEKERRLKERMVK